MEGSRRGKGKKKTPNTRPTRGWRKWCKTIVYNAKKDKKKGGQKRKKEEKEREKERKRLKKYNSKKEEFITLSPNTRACPKILFASVRV